MKRIYLLLIVIFPMLTYSQLTSTENYTHQTTYTKAVQDGFQAALSNDDKLQQVTYYDKMGRPLQNIAVEAGANKQSVVSHYEYDSTTGRQTKSYLPYAATLVNPLRYDNTVKNNIAPFYQTKYPQDFLNGVNPYSETVYEKSPVGNALKQSAPGSDWKIGLDDTDHTIKMEYKTNIDNDVYAFDVVFTAGDFLQPTISYQGYYKKNELYLTITKNENWKPTDGKLNTTETFKDKQGKTILVRNFDSIGGVATPHNLYNIYDDYGNLTFVFSPKATDALVVTPTTTYTNFTQNIPYGNVIASVLTSTATVATINQTGLNQLSINLNVTLSKGRVLKTGIITTLTTTVPDCLLGNISNGSYNFEFTIQNNKLVITDLAGVAIPLSTAISTTLTTSLPIPSTLATLAPNLLLDLCYQYRYDNKNRAVEKKIPGKGWESFVYDNLNRPILSQDANLKLTNKWLFIKYDNYGRLAYTGEYTDNRTRVAIQTERDNAVNPILFESKTNTTFTNNGAIVHYTNNVFPTNNFTIPSTPINLFSINYYDDYAFDKDGIVIPTTAYSQPITVNNKALATGSKIRTLTTQNWTTTVVAYDEKARAIWTSSKDNYLLTTNVNEVKLNFVGNPTETKTIHNKTGVITNLTTVDYFTYDHRLRLLKHTQRTGTNPLTDPIEVIAHNKYDELGQLFQKKVGGADATTYALIGLQTVDYSFNVRGWLTKINDANIMGTDLFAFELKRNKPTTSGTALYNGNISQALWRTANSDTSLKQYNYSYDNLHRLKQAQFFSTVGTTTTANTHNEVVNYDKNGNITALQRTGFIKPAVWDEWLDNLKYSYQGNQLQSVEELGNKLHGVLDPATIGNDYSYDNNGNLTLDNNKGITAINYNHFNLPLKITFSATKFIEFVYTATGTKVSKKVTNSGITTTTYYAGNYIYENTNSNPVTLQCFSQPEGYVAVNAGTYNYVYQYKDHLGNVRLSYTKNTAGILQIVEENHYYPFGVKHKGYNNAVSSLGNSTAQKFKFNGKETEILLDVTEMDFRQYDAGLGRFYGLDLLAEATPWATPNHFALNNPVIASDPTGLLIQFEGLPNDNPRSQVSQPRDGFISLFGNTEGGFIDNLQNFTGSGTGMNGGWGHGTAFSYLNGGAGGINPGRTGNDRIDGQGGHYERYSYKIYEENENPNDNTPIIKAVQGNYWVADIIDLVNKITGLSGTYADALNDYSHFNSKYVYNYGTAGSSAAQLTRANKVFQLKVAKVAKIGGKFLAGASIVTNVVQVGGDVYEGKYYSAGARTTVAAVAIGCSFIPVVGWAVAGGIGVADAIWGDQFYNFVENQMTKK